LSQIGASCGSISGVPACSRGFAGSGSLIELVSHPQQVSRNQIILIAGRMN
jgi:hypothetical protein